MGLDNYASRSPGDVSLTAADQAAFEGVGLCGGIMSGADSSFRGKVYWDLVFEVTEVSLLDEWIPPQTVILMAEALGRHAPEELAAINDRVSGYSSQPPTSPVEMANLQRFFAICAERRLGIVGWS